MWWFIVVLCTFALVSFLAWLPLRVRVWLNRQQGDDEGLLEVDYLFGLLRWKRKLFSVRVQGSKEGPSVSVNHGQPAESQSSQSWTPTPEGAKNRNHTELTTEEVWRFLKEWSRWKDAFDRLRPIVRHLLKRTWFRQFQVQLTIGTSEVVSTGLAYGATWSLINSFLAPLTYWSNFPERPHVNISADFEKARLEGSAKCIVEVRLGYAIFAGLRLARVWKSTQAEKEETDDGSSHSGVNANGHGKHSRHD